MPTVISIPIPCHEDWNKMTAKDQGKHCDVCSKTVVDFTSWMPQQILLHFENNTNVCGRFRVEQLNEPIPTKEDFVKQISYFAIPFLKKVAAIFLFVFTILASSFKAEAQGKPIICKTDTTKISNYSYGGAISKTTYTLSKSIFTKNKKLKTPKRKHKSSKRNIASEQYAFPTLIGYTVSKPKKVST
jgi:hypothetical protein